MSKSPSGAWDQLAPAVMRRWGPAACSLELSLMILYVSPMLCRGLTRCPEKLQHSCQWDYLRALELTWFQEGKEGILVSDHSLRLAWYFSPMTEQDQAVDRLILGDSNCSYTQGPHKKIFARGCIYPRGGPAHSNHRRYAFFCIPYGWRNCDLETLTSPK